MTAVPKLLYRSDALTLKKLALQLTHTIEMRFLRIVKGRNHLKKIKELGSVSPVIASMLEDSQQKVLCFELGKYCLNHSYFFKTPPLQ
jgi:hypothetical protein